MDTCCANKAAALEQMHARQSQTLRLVLWINAVMFGAEFVAGVLAGSVALMADSLDMLTDALVYGLSLYVVRRGAAWKARAALAKAAVMALFGLFVFAQLLHRLVQPEPPAFLAMGVLGVLALAANGACFAALWRHREEDINMRSVWLCSRNDLLANGLVLLAAVGVWATASAWPDIVAGGVVCAVFFRSAIAVSKEAYGELRAA